MASAAVAASPVAAAPSLFAAPASASPVAAAYEVTASVAACSCGSRGFRSCGCLTLSNGYDTTDTIFWLPRYQQRFNHYNFVMPQITVTM